jgi:toxin ParE1/3/4
MRCSRGRDGIVRLYNVLPARGVVRDFTLIEDFLFKTYRDLGDDPEEAGGRAAARVKAARAYMRTFERNPHRGTEHPEIRPGARTVTKEKFIFYFEINETEFEVMIFAVFFGGEDHRQKIMDRLQT